jgi:hypothetical protein
VESSEALQKGYAEPFLSGYKPLNLLLQKLKLFGSARSDPQIANTKI